MTLTIFDMDNKELVKQWKKEKLKEKKYHLNEKYRETRRKHYQKNKEKIKERRLKNIVNLRKSQKKYREKNKEYWKVRYREQKNIYLASQPDRIVPNNKIVTVYI